MGQQAPGPAGWVTGAVAALVFLTGAARVAIDRVAGPVTTSGPTSGAQAGAWFGAVMPGTSGSVDALLRIGDGSATGAPRIPVAPAGQVPSPTNSPLLGGQRFESTVATGTLSTPSDASPSADPSPSAPAPSSSPQAAPATNTPTASPSPAPPPSTTTTTSPPPATTTTTSPPPSSTTTTTNPPSTTSTTSPSSTTTTTSPPPATPTSQG